jgi:hypothetical protein
VLGSPGLTDGVESKLRAGVELLETSLAERKICVQAAMKDLATLPYV